MSSQYSLMRHTILPLIYKIYLSKSFLYLIKDPQTKSLIMINPPKNIQPYLAHIKNITSIADAKLSYSFCNSNEIFSMDDVETYTPQKLNQLQPKVIGDLSFCFIRANGYKPDFNLIAITHMTQQSTKIPILMTGELIKVSSIDYLADVKAQSYLKSLEKVKYFPNETYIFPSSKVQVQDLQFSRKLIKDHRLMNQKLAIYEKHKDKQDVLIPTTILQEKSLNPFFNAGKVLGLNSEQIKAFNMLRKIRSEWKNQKVL